MSKKNIIKILAIIFALITLCTCATLVVNAANAGVNINDEEAHRGETITFNATISGSIEVGSGSLSISYDSSFLELINGSCNVGGAMLSSFDVSKGKGAFAFSGTGTVSGNLFTATFRVKDSASFGTTSVSLNITLKDASNTVVSTSSSGGSITIACNHSFTKEDTTYIKSAATCTSPAIYYKSCVTCGEKGSATFEYGTTSEHSYTRKVTSDEYIKSSASCTSKAVYYYCCATCDAKGTTTFEYGSTLAHNYTRKVVDDSYKKLAATCTNAAVYYYCCTTCDAKGATTFEYGDVLGHTGGTATCTAKAICTRCSQEYGDTLDHTYNQEVAQDKYLASEASCTAKAKYYKSCACGAKGVVTFEVGEKKAHAYTEKVDALYLKSAATCTAKAVYYESCSVCGEKGTATFETGAAPSHTYKSTWNSDSTLHWHECSKCGDKKDSDSHIAGDAATEYTAQTCTVCRYVITPAFGHTHHYSTDWSKDADNHWHECSGCSDTKDKTAHDYTNACDTDCNTCGYTREITHAYKTEWSKNEEAHWYECEVCGNKKNEAPHTIDAITHGCDVCSYGIKETAWTNPFNDVKESNWFFEAVKYVNTNKLMSGTSTSTFAPNEKLTRAMFVTILYRLENEPSIKSDVKFTDVDKDTWYTNAVVWASENGIVYGVNENEFAPNANITREQIATIMHRYSAYKNYSTSIGEASISSYKDADAISGFAVDAMKYAVGSGLITGKTATTLNPKDNATRAEIAIIIQRFVENIK